MERIQRVLFVIFLLAYLVALPVILLRVLGYEVRLSGRSPIVETGGIFLATDPLGATVAVGGTRYSRTTPLSVFPLSPGSYTVRLELAGYRPWEATVEVKPGRVTDLGSIVLLPEKPVRTQVSPLRFTALVPIGLDSFILLQRSPLLRDLYVCDRHTGEIVPVAGAASPFAGAPIESVGSQPGSSTFLLRLGRGTSGPSLLATISWPNIQLLDLGAFGLDGFERAAWTDGDPGDLFLLRNGRVDWVRLPERTVRRSFLQGVRGFGLFDGSLYVVDGTLNVQRIDLATGHRTAVSGVPDLTPAFSPAGFVRIDPVSRQLLALHAEDGAFMAVLGASGFSLHGVRGFAADPFAGVIAAWQQRSIAVVDLSSAAEPRDPVTGSSTIVPWWPVEQAGDIRQAFLVYGDSNVLYRDGSLVSLAGPREAIGRRPEPIVAVRDGTAVAYSDHDGRLYFIDAATGTLSWMEVVARPQPVRGLLMGLRR